MPLMVMITVANAFGTTGHEVLRQMIFGFYDILFWKVPVQSHDIFCVTVFRGVTSCFVVDKLVVVSIVFFVYLSLSKSSCVLSVTIGADFALKARCFG